MILHNILVFILSLILLVLLNIMCFAFTFYGYSNYINRTANKYFNENNFSSNSYKKYKNDLIKEFISIHIYYLVYEFFLSIFFNELVKGIIWKSTLKNVIIIIIINYIITYIIFSKLNRLDKSNVIICTFTRDNNKFTLIKIPDLNKFLIIENDKPIKCDNLNKIKL